MKACRKSLKLWEVSLVPSKPLVGDLTFALPVVIRLCPFLLYGRGKWSLNVLSLVAENGSVKGLGKWEGGGGG